MNNIIIAAKCAPEQKILEDIKKAALPAVELYLSQQIIADLSRIIKLCKKFPFRYAVHAPNDGSDTGRLSELVMAIGAEVVIFHNIYWEDEWESIIAAFRKAKVKLCLENTFSVHEPLKFMRRYGLSRCLDLEHLQLECAGVYEEEFVRVIKQAQHIHLTGYIYGSGLWHTHLHHSPEHSLYFLNLVKKCGYSGFVVSEAKLSLQTYVEFKKLHDFFSRWR
jgi:hypothetical protein